MRSAGCLPNNFPERTDTKTHENSLNPFQGKEEKTKEQNIEDVQGSEMIMCDATVMDTLHTFVKTHRGGGLEI